MYKHNSVYISLHIYASLQKNFIDMKWESFLRVLWRQGFESGCQRQSDCHIRFNQQWIWPSDIQKKYMNWRKKLWKQIRMSEAIWLSHRLLPLDRLHSSQGMIEAVCHTFFSAKPALIIKVICELVQKEICEVENKFPSKTTLDRP